jgi:hypothetical protein
MSAARREMRVSNINFPSAESARASEPRRVQQYSFVLDALCNRLHDAAERHLQCGKCTKKLGCVTFARIAVDKDADG